MDKYEIKKNRIALGLTQKELAEKMGVTLQTIQHWEQGRRKMSGPAEKLLEYLIKDANTQ